MSVLPEGWCEATLADLGEWSSGGTPSRKVSAYYGGTIPWVKTGDLDHAVLDRVEEFLTAEGVKNSAAKVFPEGSLLVAMYGATIGQTAVLGMEAATNQACAALLSEGETAALIPFVWRYLISIQDDLRAAGQGGAQPNISQTILKSYPISIAPLPEQRRIVAKIDNLTGKSRRARDHLDHIPRLVEKYKQAVLAAAFRGDLTREWRAGRALEWRGNRPLKELCVSVTDGDHQAPPKATNGIPFITISAMNDGLINLGKATRFVPETYLNSLTSTRRASRGDVLYSVTGSFGISALVDFDDPFVFQRHIAILRPDPGRLDALFLFRMLSSPEVMEQADSVATGTAQRTVPLSGLRSFTIPAPSLSEQHEIVRRLEIVFDWINRLASEATSARRLIDKLDQAVLAKAFRGELVPQNPDDEPAGVLLERIRAERGAVPKVKRGRKSKVPV